MIVNDPIGDMITRIRNGQSANLMYVASPFSKLRADVLKVLNEEGYIKSFEVIQGEKFKEIKIYLKYNSNNAPAISEVKRVSKPGRRVYSSVDDLKLFYNGLGTVIVSTSKGVMPGYKAKQIRAGGEILCCVF